MVTGHGNIFSSLHFTVTADRDYMPGPYTVSFSAGDTSAILMVPTIDDVVVEMSETFSVVIESFDKPSVVEIGSTSIATVTIKDNEPGTYTM